MFVFPYKIRVYIVVVSIKIHNYIRNKSQEDVVYIESDRYSNFFLNDFLIDVVSLSQTHGNKRSFYMDYVYDRIATSLMGQWKWDYDSYYYIYDVLIIQNTSM